LTLLPSAAAQSYAFLRQDTPDEHDDELQLRPFVERIASALSNTNEAGAFVVSVEAPWGRGKTWCLEELKRQLCVKFEALHRVEDFNPWLLSDHKQIVQSLLLKIRTWVDASDTASIRELASDIAKFAAVLSKGNDLADHFGAGFSLGPVLGAVAKLPAGKLINLDELKAKVVKDLKSAKTRLFVFVDDLDRVTPDEFISAIRAIKAVANFPHVTYILAFDGEVADQQLRSAGIERGSEYLDKIIQLRAPLPPITREQKRILLDHACGTLSTNIDDLPPEHQFGYRISKLFQSGLADVLRTPRDIKRVLNRLQLLSIDVFRDVNLADLVALAAVEIVDQHMFKKLVEHSTAFVSPERPYETSFDELRKLNQESKDKGQSYRDWLVKLVDENSKPATRKLLHELFHQIWSKHRYNAPIDLKLGYISHPRNFDIALRGMQPSDSVPTHALRRVTHSTADNVVIVLRDLADTYTLEMVIRGLRALLPYESPIERTHIWYALRDQVRADAINRESLGTRFVVSLAAELTQLIYWTERLARIDESSQLLPYSFRDWALENLRSTLFAMCWPHVIAVAEENGDRPHSLRSMQSWSAAETTAWNAELLTTLVEGNKSFFESALFLNEPDAGYLLHTLASELPEYCKSLLAKLSAEDHLFFKLVERIVFARRFKVSGHAKHQVLFDAENPLLTTNPEIIGLASEKLASPAALTRKTRTALLAITSGKPVDIDALDFSAPSNEIEYE
jgi:hypothetical protein